MTAIYSSKDNMILPATAATLPWGTNVQLDGMGHTGLIYRCAALNAAIAGLREDAHDAA